MLTLLLSTAPVHALASHSSNDISFSEVETFLLEGVLAFEDIYTLSECVDIGIGLEIPFYIISDNSQGYTKSEISYFPIVSNSTIVGILQVYQNFDGDTIFSYSEGYADALNRFISQNSAIALIAEGQAVSLVSTQTSMSLSETATATFSELSDFDLPLCHPLSVIQTLNISSSLRATPDTYTLPVNLKLQSENWDCWAACVASMGQFYGGASLTSLQVADAVGIHTTATMYQTRSALSSVFGVTTSRISQSPVFSDIVYNTYNRSAPLVAGFSGPKVGHMVVIRGYASGSSYLNVLFMDPGVGYSSVSVLQNQPLTITWAGVLYTCNEYLVK